MKPAKLKSRRGLKDQFVRVPFDDEYVNVTWRKRCFPIYFDDIEEAKSLE